MGLQKTPDKKAVEMHLLRRFISSPLHGLRIKSIDQQETPDFVIHELNQTISVEITRLIHPKLMEQEAFQKRIVELAWQKFKTRHRGRLQVLVNFNRLPTKVKGKNINQYVDELHDLVEGIWINNQQYEFRVSNMGHNRDRNGWIDSISVNNMVDIEYWQPFGAYRVDRIDPTWVNEVILTKEKNLNRYGHLYDQNWLLLAANFGHRSSTHDFYFFAHEQIDSDFDHVFLYKSMDNTFTRLR
jgi:hypothetical protein